MEKTEVCLSLKRAQPRKDYRNNKGDDKIMKYVEGKKY